MGLFTGRRMSKVKGRFEIYSALNKAMLEKIGDYCLDCRDEDMYFHEKEHTIDDLIRDFASYLQITLKEEEE